MKFLKKKNYYQYWLYGIFEVTKEKKKKNFFFFKKIFLQKICKLNYIELLAINYSLKEIINDIDLIYIKPLIICQLKHIKLKSQMLTYLDYIFKLLIMFKEKKEESLSEKANDAGCGKAALHAGYEK